MARRRFADIRPFFEKDEWAELGDYEKTSYKNAKENYEAMISAGLAPRKPFFMMTKEEKVKSEKVIKPAAPAKPKRLEPLEPSRKSRRVQAMYCPDKENQENPAASEMLYCIDCDAAWTGNCPKHCPYKVLENAEVADDCPAEDRVESSLPAELALRDLESDGTETTTARVVVARVELHRRTRLGPYEGDVPEDDEQPSSQNNWMALVRDVSRLTRNKSITNVVSIEYCGRLYFVTTRDIQAGEELLVRYPQAFKVDEVCGREFYSPVTMAQHRRANMECAAEVARRRRVLAQAKQRAIMYRPSPPPSPTPKLSMKQASRARVSEKQKRELKRELQELTVHQMLDVEKLIEEGSHDCPVCKEHFGRSCRLRAHMQRCHQAADNSMRFKDGNSDPYACPHCKASFTASRELRSHVKMTHFDLWRQSGAASDLAASETASVAASASALASETASEAVPSDGESESSESNHSEPRSEASESLATSTPEATSLNTSLDDTMDSTMDSTFASV